jgi:hypothetical protein
MRGAWSWRNRNLGRIQLNTARLGRSGQDSLKGELQVLILPSTYHVVRIRELNERVVARRL